MDPYQQQNQTPQPPQPLQTAPLEPPTNYGAPQQPSYDPQYLDSIAPPPPKPSFLSGSFGKIFFILIGVFVLAVSLIVAFSGKDNTADLQQVTARMNNMALTSKTVQPDLKSNNLSTINSMFQTWITTSRHQAESLLQQAGVKKSQYNRTMVAEEKNISEELTSKFEDARLNAVLDRVYASTMASETDKLIILLNAIAKNSKAKLIRDYAKSTSEDLAPIQKGFAEYLDNGN